MILAGLFTQLVRPTQRVQPPDGATRVTRCVEGASAGPVAALPSLEEEANDLAETCVHGGTADVSLSCAWKRRVASCGLDKYDMAL